ncbi:glutamyl aminopeptidase-like [Odontomachus brunneus]|uniref:glutamyl aminopeptidase-like n=1 Tax=Odontomachus brunneus TaxID=486640 RepID=UPI0013F21C46|nr:glutamyl aminopeptidase-like [Odontomachus brunneus]
MIFVRTVKHIAAGEYFLRMNFSGRLTGTMKGLYLSTYTNFGHEPDRKLLVTQFEPAYARMAFPCFDEPSFKAIFHIRLVHSARLHYRALSNMPISKITSATNNSELMITYFAPTPPMSTYLVAFVVSDFECLTSSIDSSGGKKIPLSVCTRAVYRNEARFALRFAARAMKYYSDLFGIDYHLPKLDLVAIPDFASGAMENWGLVTFRETKLLHDEARASYADARNVALTVAHELAHMWFGDAVTMKWWNDLWLNEGFATYMQHRAVDSAFPAWQQMASFPLNTKYIAMKDDCKPSTRAVATNVETPDEIGEKFDRMSYQKAAAVINMLENAMGKSRFVNGIKNYLERYQFRNAESRELFEILHHIDRGTVNIVEFMDRWTKQSGFPLVNVRQDGKTFRLSQERFVVNKKREKEKFTETWIIPLKYATDDENEGVKFDWFLANFSCVELSVERPVQWIKLNHGSIGYYIVNYTEDAWARFDDLLSRDMQALDAIDRADLLHDAFLLADATDMCYCIAMNLSTYLRNETALQPWIIASQWLIQTGRLLHDTHVYARFQRYARALISGMYRRFNWNVDSSESFGNRELRAIILHAACSVAHKHCLAFARNSLREFAYNHSAERPHPDVRSIVYSFGIAMRSDDVEAVFETLWQRFLQETDIRERERLMIALASVRNATVLSRYLEIATNENYIRRQDFFEVLVRIALNPVGLDIAWNYIRSSWNDLVGKYTLNDYAMGNAIATIVSLFKDETRFREALRFFDEHPEAGVGANARISAIEEVKFNINWLRINVQRIDQWLRVSGCDQIPSLCS